MSDLTRDAEGSRAAKIALRSRLLTARRHLDETTRRDAAQALQDQILELVRREHPSTIAAYVPIDPEPGGAGLPGLLARHARVLLPVLLPDGDLDWVAYSGELTAGPRGLLEPVGPRLGVEAIRSAELILVPALAVDRAGIRMGRGGGSYDRALARLDPTRLPARADAGGAPTGPDPARVLTVALLHEGELVDEVPAEPHDRAVDGALTPRGGITLNRAAEWTK
jgi:5-formyltetrahydrofolate cyclo-ligase